ncbi:MAG: helix-turn-helix transcriptional regulator [Niabella sp.]
MTRVTFLDDATINVVARDGEVFTLTTYLPVQKSFQREIADFLAQSFEKSFEDDKTSMVYWVLMDAIANGGFSFFYVRSDRQEERERIGAKIRQIRESKGFEAKKLATLVNIDSANLCRIEQGRYSVGLDILAKIASALGVKVDLV